jgi:hypothetical protein
MQLSEQIQSYIQNSFETQNYIPDDSEIYAHFQHAEPSEHLIGKEISYFFRSYEVYADTRIEWEGDVTELVVRHEMRFIPNKTG